MIVPYGLRTPYQYTHKTYYKIQYSMLVVYSALSDLLLDVVRLTNVLTYLLELTYVT